MLPRHQKEARWPATPAINHMALQARADIQTAKIWQIHSLRSLESTISTIRYLDESVTSLRSKMDSLMEMVRIQMGQNQQLATLVAQLTAHNRREPSSRRDLPSAADGNDDFEMIGQYQVPQREGPFREMTTHREIKPKRWYFAPNHSRQSLAPFVTAGREPSAYPHTSLFNRQTGSPFETKPYYTRIKRNNVGQFNPDYPGPQDLRMISDGKTLVLTDVTAFRERFYTITTSPEGENQALSLFDTLLSGSTLIWWNSKLTAEDRQEL
ncbi:hypothetical protein CONLIGDRAFT_650648 [Coniochaeta ligniaria NRRL 30616]|uniref:Uncharacterized protein n=1 Tax=Coniochaeta ligniaria NRRL 30616 TaxID=1408157 RepID=A0A1J7IMH3_9PEZI|nr:hypothetical protein CONLIGDRAFT_650648 [Coniochaeta ligniaria NRRL 30616]